MKNLTKSILIALFLGIVIGLGLNLFAPEIFTPIDQYFFAPLGDIFLRLIQMMVIPIVFISIVLGVANLGDPKKLGRIGGKTILFFLSTTAIAITIAMSLAFLFQPGEYDPDLLNSEEATFEAEEAPSVVDTLINIIPTNPIQAMTSGEMLQIIFFAVFLGFGLAILSKKTDRVLRLFEQANELVMYLIQIIMYTAPFGAFGLIASAVGGAGIDAIMQMLAYFLVVLAGLIIHAIITYGSVIKFMIKKSPLWFFKNFSPAMSVAFGTASSSGTLPVSMKTAQENLGVRKPVSSFVQPLGATINMDGTAIMQGVATVFIAQVSGVDLTFTQIITVVLIAILASVGTAGVPGVGLIMLAMVLDQVGLPVEAIGLILGVDRLLDMTRTAVNITGDATCALLISESEGDVEEKKPSISDEA
ncbi:dicarboxylate/amino acid:cation symporter [Tenuibacillus multivorans]|uniref:Na+/H+-dicarboxylate symporter n=1 Tax=Tenuibacillus multivorans TaxID=237069 RepID=A0A1H0DE47_9BACI|nr:dicarboxylate/amino acid:cation symporter [Tenuibacillus multivorans]GEL76592.1 sodium:dicarboxylate symporter [Tenuibacillus multivorans]SDN68382.1 Na+/H+-dicarboxylate symporter [Tenuibacillus multivorans]